METLDRGQRLLIDLVNLSWVELTTKLWGGMFLLLPLNKCMETSYYILPSQWTKFT